MTDVEPASDHHTPNGARARNDFLEEAARICEALAASVMHPNQTITDRCAAAIRAAKAAPASAAEPVAWRCKDFADGWILDQSERSAKEYAKKTGCLLQALFTTPPDVLAAVNALSDEQVRHIADSKDVASCRARLSFALGLTIDT